MLMPQTGSVAPAAPGAWSRRCECVVGSAAVKMAALLRKVSGSIDGEDRAAMREIPGSGALRPISMILAERVQGRRRPDEPDPAGRIAQSGGDLHRRAFCDGLHRPLHLPDPALWPVARHERERDRPAGRRPLAAGGVLFDPYWRADGPVRHPPGHAVLCLER